MGEVTAKLNDDGSTSLTIDLGGVATEIVAVTAESVTVRNAAGAVSRERSPSNRGRWTVPPRHPRRW